MAGTYLCNKFCNYSDLHIFCKDIGSPSGDQSKTVNGELFQAFIEEAGGYLQVPPTTSTQHGKIKFSLLDFVETCLKQSCP